MLTANITSTELRRIGAGDYVVVAEVLFTDDQDTSLNHEQTFTAQSSDDGDPQYLKRLIRQYIRRLENLQQLKEGTTTGAVGDEPAPSPEQQQANQWFDDYAKYRRRWAADVAGLLKTGTPPHDTLLTLRSKLKTDFQARFISDDRFELVLMDAFNGLSLNSAN